MSHFALRRLLCRATGCFKLPVSSRQDRERDYDTEDALSSPEDEETVNPLRRDGSPHTGQLTRGRDRSPVNVRSHSAHSRVLAIAGVERSFPQLPVCAIAGCSWPARASEGHPFCSQTCSLLVRTAWELGLGIWLTRDCLSGLQSVEGRAFRTGRTPIEPALCSNPACGKMNRFAEGHIYCGRGYVKSCSVSFRLRAACPPPLFGQ